MKNFFRKIWDAIVSFINKIPKDKLLHVIAGLIIAAIFALPLHMKVCIVPVIFAGFIKVFFDMWTKDEGDWWDFAAVCAGGLVIQLLAIFA